MPGSPLRPTATEVKPMEDYCLCVTFDNGERKVFDVKPYLRGDWFGQLKDPDLFQTVHVAGLSIEWAGGQDICPDRLWEDSMPAAQG